MAVVDDYVEGLSGPKQAVVRHMCQVVTHSVPGVTQERSYGMPAYKYRGKSLISILANQNFMSVYPYCSVERLGIDVSMFEGTKGSIHFSLDNPIPDGLLRKIVLARKELIDSLA